MKISFTARLLPQKGVLILPVFEDKIFEGVVAQMDSQMQGGIQKACRTISYKGKAKSLLDILSPSQLDLDRLILFGLGSLDDYKKACQDKTDHLIFEDMGGMMARQLAPSAPDDVCIYLPDILDGEAQKAASIGFGALLGAYRFDKYRTRLKQQDKNKVKALQIAAMDHKRAQELFQAKEALAEGICLARDLAHEPANVLYPEEFAKRVKAMSKIGIKVDVLGEAQMKKLGMGSLLGVGQGSVRESQLAVMRWNGGKPNQAPFAIVGKGVCFDTGGISIKPAGGMEDMRADMGGAACVTGLLHTLARRKAKVNAVGVIGLVENMPDGNAQRPGDIVESMSGQTIEVLNTDAEGRLVLADALWYAQEKFKPKAIVNFATLTGAIIIALGKEYAGLFSNNDDLAKKLYSSGLVENEKVWRLPLAQAYDKKISSKNADIKNISNGREAGSVTAAQFLQRFIKKDMPWAHVDIAGVAMGSPATPISSAWANGFGVRLMDGLIRQYYEGA